MLSSGIPTKFSAIWASSAGAGFITEPIPLTTASVGRASLQQGFPPSTFEQESAGGNPPWGADANGILFMLSAWAQWESAGGPTPYDATFASNIGGYPKGALLASTSKLYHFWQSTAESNSTNPDSGGANWALFPDVFIQQQAGNFASVDSGSANAPVISLSPVPASWASIAGAPIRFLIANAVTVTNPQLTITGVTGAKTMINTDGTGISSGQITRAGQLVEGFYDPIGDVVQITSPPKPPGGGAATVLAPGMILICPRTTPFVGTLECNGAVLNITDYPNLFNAIGNRFGGDGVSTFQLPDLRGTFIRGWDHGRGLDVDSSQRTSQPLGAGTLVGDTVGGWEIPGIGNSFKLANPTINFPATTWSGVAGPGSPVSVAAASFPITFPLSNYVVGNTNPYDVYAAYPTGTGFGPDGLGHTGQYPLTGGLTLYGGQSSNPLFTNQYSAAMLMPDQGFNNVGSSGFLMPNTVSVTIGWIGGQDQNGSSDVRPVNIAMMYVIVY